MADPDHIPVLADEVLGLLDPQEGETYADCTAGLGGHASAVGAHLGAGGTVVLCDLDQGNVRRAAGAVESSGAGSTVTVHGNFADLPRRLTELGLAADLVLADLGFASNQVDDAARGLSFRADGPLDMRLDTSAPITAAEIVNTWSEDDLADLIRRYGEERHARRIARKVVGERASGPIQTTRWLAEIVRSACPSGPGRIDPATRTFQALRIVVNDELGSLERLLRSVEQGAAREGGWLNPGARIAFIAFHSLEDRLVKRAFAGLVSRGEAESLTRGPVLAGEAETARNKRARSAKLRAVRLLGQEGRGPGRG